MFFLTAFHKSYFLSSLVKIPSVQLRSSKERPTRYNFVPDAAFLLLSTKKALQETKILAWDLETGLPAHKTRSSVQNLFGFSVFSSAKEQALYFLAPF